MCNDKTCDIIEIIQQLQASSSRLFRELTKDQHSGDDGAPERSSGSVKAPSSEGARDISEDSNSTVEQADKTLEEISQTVTDLIILETEGNVDRERIRRISHQMAQLSKSLEELASSQAEICGDDRKLISDKIHRTLSELFYC